jgi:ParB family transcriptional regulator, chromosome partitioning protein
MKISAFKPIDLGNDNEGVLGLVKIRPNPEQPRKVFDENALHELACSIKEHGVIQPILVKKSAENIFYIIAGERRWRAAKLAGLEKIPVIIRDVSNKKGGFIALIENIQREDLSILEEARAIKQLVEKYELTHQEIATKIGKSRAMVTNLIRILNLMPEVINLLAFKKIEFGHAKILAGVDSPEEQLHFANAVAKKELTVRQLEKMMRGRNKTEDKNSSSDKPADFSALAVLVKKISPAWSEKVQFNVDANYKGTINIKISGFDECKKIVALLP